MFVPESVRVSVSAGIRPVLVSHRWCWLVGVGFKHTQDSSLTAAAAAPVVPYSIGRVGRLDG